MPDLDTFTPLGKPRERVVCREAETAKMMGVPPLDYPKEMNDGSKPATHREYEMWMLGRKYAHALHAGTAVSEQAMNEAKAAAEAARERLFGYRRDRCWHADNQRAFLEVLAGGGSVTEGCEIVGLSTQSAYRHRARDDRFRVAWEAALVLGQPRILEEIVDRARNGQTETWQRVGTDGHTTYITKKRYDNAHALRVLDRLHERNGAEGEWMDRVDATIEDFDAVLAGIKTEVDYDEPKQSTVDELFTVPRQPASTAPKPGAAKAP